MAVEQDPLIHRPGQVKELASAIDERVRLRLGAMAAKRISSNPKLSESGTAAISCPSSSDSSDAQSVRPGLSLMGTVFLLFLSISVLCGVMAFVAPEDPASAAAVSALLDANDQQSGAAETVRQQLLLLLDSLACCVDAAGVCQCANCWFL